MIFNHIKICSNNTYMFLSWSEDVMKISTYKAIKNVERISNNNIDIHATA